MSQVWKAAVRRERAMVPHKSRLLGSTAEAREGGARSESGAVSLADRRRHGRVRCDGLSSSLGRVVELSAGGFRVRYRGSGLDPGTRCVALIHGPDGGFEAVARVAWTRRAGLFTRESGLEFEGLAGEARSVLTSLVWSQTAQPTLG